MPIREINLPDDLQHVSDLLLHAFVYPENPEWTIQQDEAYNLRDTVATMRALWPVYNLLKVFSPKIRDALLGFIWEEDGKPVGLVTVSRRGSGDSWLVGNVGVLPEYRRRGIARKLVTAGLELIRERGGNHAVLEVIDGNLPAYHLYEDLGFKHFSDYASMTAAFKKAPPLPKVPDGYRFQVVPMRDWKTNHDMAKKVTPQEVQRFDPITKGRYHTPAALRLFVRLITWLRGTQQEDFALIDLKRDEVAALGYLTAESKGGRHSIAVILGEEQAELAPYMLAYMLYVVLNVDLERKVETVLPAYREYLREHLERAGFVEKKRWNRMGMELDAGSD